MDIRDLKLFRHLASTLHFTKSSQACNISASGLTRTIQRLENELGQNLFNRDNRSVSLTEAGELLKDYADEAIDRWSTLQHHLAGDHILKGELTLYCSVTAILSILPDILDPFRKAHPQVQINLQTGDAAMALMKLNNREADVTIAALPDRLPRHLQFLTITETPLIFIGPVDYPDTIKRKKKKRKNINWRKTPIIMAERGLSRKRVEEWFAAKKIKPNIYSYVSGNEALIAMVSLGCGVGVVPKLVLDKSPLQDRIEILNVKPRLKPFSVGLCTTSRNKLGPTVRAFWEMVEKSHQG